MEEIFTEQLNFHKFWKVEQICENKSRKTYNFVH